MATKPSPIDAYLAGVRGGQRAALEKLRRTIRFAPDRPLPAALVRKIVKARLAENAGRASTKGGTSARTKERRAR